MSDLTTRIDRRQPSRVADDQLRRTYNLQEGVTQMLTGPFDRVLAQALRRSLEVPCLTVDPELFFAESPEDVETAKAMCAECPVRVACLTAALERQEPWGVWGAELFVQGVIVARKRPRGRPRKEVAA